MESTTAVNNSWSYDNGKKIHKKEINYISESFVGGKRGLGFKGGKGIEYAKPFQFLNLGVLAYVGASTALAQIDLDDKKILGQGKIGFLLWRGIYWFKQVGYLLLCW